MRIIILPSPFSRQGLASTMVATRVLNSSFVQLDMAASPRRLKRWNGRIFGGWWWGFHVARWRRWSWVYPCSTALRCWDCWIFCYSRFCGKKKGPRGKFQRVEIWQKRERYGQFDIFRNIQVKGSSVKIQRACLRPAHACVSYQYMSTYTVYIIFLKRLSKLLPLVHFGTCLTKTLRRAVAEKYFAAALPDVRRLVGWVSLGCSSQRPKMAWLTGRQAAKKSAREETFDAMEYVDSKVPSCWPGW